MNINVKKGGDFIIPFVEYFPSVEKLKEFIKSKNKFININALDDKMNLVYKELKEVDKSIKLSALDWLIMQKLNFKYKRPNTLSFWIERGYGIKEFNNYNNERVVGNQYMNKKNICNIKPLLKNNINVFNYGTFKYKSYGIPSCNLCGCNLKVSPAIGCYDIIGCENNNCASYKNKDIITIRHLAFLPIELFLKKNKKINIKSKLSKEYWLLKGFSYETSNSKINEIKKNIKNVNNNSFEFYKLTIDISDEEIFLKINNSSQFNVNYWIARGMDVNKAKEKISDLQKTNSKKFAEIRKNNPLIYSAVTTNQIGYWEHKGYTTEEAKNKVSERQTTFSKKMCIEKYGEVEGIGKFKERQKKWLLNNKKSNFSKISQDLFWGILYSYASLKNDDIYFATYLNGEKDESGKNNEYRLSVNESFVLPDFFNKTTGKIIEFDGVYYHRATPQNELREEKRDKMILDNGYQILHVNEFKYKEDKQKSIIECINFLKNK